MNLHVLYSFPTRIGTTGIGTTAWHQVAALAALGAKVTLCCGSCERPIPRLHRLVETMRLGRVKIPYRLVGHDRAYRRHDHSVARLISRSSGEFNVFHGWPLGSLESLRAARRKGIPTILERPNAHTAAAYEIVAQEHRKLDLAVLPDNTHIYNRSRLEREEAEYDLADKLACPSEFVARTFRDRGFPEERIAMRPYGYDPALFSCGARHSNAQAAARPFTFLFVGRCEPRKGLHHALRAWHLSGVASDSRFVICGSFVTGYRERLGMLLNHPSIVEAGFVKDVHAAMGAADVLVLPSLEEGSALVTYEARACGCVLLVSDASGAPATHMLDGMVHPAGDVMALSQHVADVYRNRMLFERLRHESLQSINDCTWERSADRLKQIYEQMVVGVETKSAQDHILENTGVQRTHTCAPVAPISETPISVQAITES